MNLKKSDKIIAIVAVIILIVAAIGVILYVPSEDEVKPTVEEKETYIYDVECRVLNTTATPDKTQFIVKDKLDNSGNYVGNVEIPKKNLKSVEFKFSYTDKNRGLFGFGFLGKKIFGTDTLKINIKDSEKNKVGGGQIKGSGNAKITTEENGAMHFDSIEAESEREAEQQLKENLTMYDSEMETYTIAVSLDIKEGFFLKFFGWLREKLFGNDQFKLTITYYYYDYYLGEPEETEGGGGTTTGTNTQVQDWKTTPYASANLVGFH